MKLKAVIFDIDNTLLSQTRRLLKAYNVMMKKNYTIEELKQKGKSKFELPVHLLGSMDDETLKRYYRDFLTTKYYDKKVDYNLDVVDGSIDFLRKLDKNGVKIIYMSARINCEEINHNKITVEMLKYFNFPLNNNTEIHLLESDHIPNSSKDFHILADKFKSTRSKELMVKYDIIAGIGDAKSDISAFNSANVLSIQARTVIPEMMYDENAKLSFKSWNELYDFNIFGFMG